jgi:hypothetical protein
MANSSSVPRGFIGHLGHLTAEQEEALVIFKGNLLQANLYKASTEGHAASHDDSTLL